MSFENQHTVFLLEILAGVGLILYSLRSFSGALQALSSQLIHNFFHKVSANPLSALFSGIVISLLVHSRRKTILAALSYSNIGILNLNQLLRFLVGTNLGTCFSPLALILLPTTASTLGLGLGTIIFLSNPSKKINEVGRLLFQVGLILLGFKMIVSGAGHSLTLQGGWQNVLYSIQDLTMPNGMNGYFWIWTALFGAITILIRSSVAAILLVLALVFLNIVSVWLAPALVMGVNIGIVGLGLMEVRKLRRKEKQANVAHLTSHFIAVLFIFVFYESVFSALLNLGSLFGLGTVGHREGGDWIFLVAIFHILYNFSVTITFSILHRPLISISGKIVKQNQKKENQRLLLLGNLDDMAPSMSMDLLFQEINKLAAMVLATLGMALEGLTESKTSLEANGIDKISSKEKSLEEGHLRVEKYDSIISNTGKEISNYVDLLISSGTSVDFSHRLKSFPVIVEELDCLARQSRRMMDLLEKMKIGEIESSRDSNFLDLKVSIGKLSEETVAFFEEVYTEINLHKGRGITSRMSEVINLKESLHCHSNDLFLKIIAAGQSRKDGGQWVPLLLEMERSHCTIFRIAKWVERL